MVAFYVYYIEHGRFTLADVPSLWYVDVKKKLIEDGFMPDPDAPIPTEPAL